MSRYIILSFAFMGLAFYELSGGADFEPGSHTTADALGFAEKPTVPTEIVSRADTAATPLIGLARARVDKADVAPASGPAKSPALSLAALEAPAVARAAANPPSGRKLLAPSDRTEPAIAGGDDAAGRSDLRAVDGSRVNLRSGPGTSFSVVTQLGKGDAVEVLQDTGDGWLNLRVVETGRTGWMADFLVTASVR